MTATTSYRARHRASDAPSRRALQPRRTVGLFTTMIVSMAGLAGVSMTALAAPATADPPQTVAGRVFEDYNANGAIDTGANTAATDVGVPAADVTVTDSSGATVGTGASIGNGTFSIAVTSPANAAVRVEIKPPSGFHAGPQGADSGTTVQFVTVGTPAALAVDVALSRVGDYSQPNPRILNIEQTAAIRSDGTTPLIDLATKPSLVSSAYSDRGTTTPTTEATAAQTGTVWGVAQLGAEYGFTAASFKRHAPTGPGGLGQIYLTDLSAGPNASQWVTIPDAGTNPRGDESSYTFNDWFHDSAAFPQVGKIGLGGMAMAPDNSALYVVNLNNKNLYRVPITLDGNGAPQAGTPTAISLPTDLPGAATGCDSSDVRPYGVNAQNGALWVTLTCTGPGPTDLRGYVYRYDLAAGDFDSAPAFETALSGNRGQAFHGCTPACTAAWNAWPSDATFPITATGSNVPATHPEPVLSSVVFDSNGDMTIGIKDRFSDQIGYEAGNLTAGDNSTYEGVSAGDTLRACGTAAMGWTLENNAGCGTRTGNGAGNNQGPGGGEFYADDYTSYHDQVTLGGLLQLPGYSQVVSTAFDPGTTVRTAGVRFESNTNGASDDFHQLVAPVARSGNDLGDQGSFSKAGGLGAVAALVTAAPIEIGNRVWLDSNYNGQQDAGEPSLAGVTVHLYAAGTSTPLGTAVTDSSGNYYFSSAPGTSTTSAIYGVTLQPGTDYTVALDRTADYDTNGPLDGYELTTTRAGTDTAIDSNGVLVSGTSQAAVTTGAAGVDDHTIDFGFVNQTYAVGDFVWRDSNGNGVQDTGEPGVPGVRVTLLNADGTPAQHADGTAVMPVQTDSAGHYSFDFLAAGSYTASFSMLPAGYVLTTQAAGTDETVDSNPVVSTGVTPAFDVGPAGTADMRPVVPADDVTRALTINPTIDAGLVPGPSVSVGDFVWDDSNHNGIQDSGEPGLTGVTVTLTGPGGGAVTDIYGNQVAPVQTGSTGAYLFDNLPVLPSGESYTTHVDNSQSALTGYLPTLTGQGTASTDSSDGHASSGDLTSGGASDLTLDYGFVRPVSVGDFVWVDTNHNGLQDAGEPGISGVVLTITDTAGNQVTDLSGDTVGPQTTDSQGAYHFTNLSPGQYVVHVDNAQTTLLTYSPTDSDAGTDRTKDSDNGTATSSVLTSGGSDQSLDFGFLALTYAVGDFVWTDSNGNGIQDSGEPGVAGVTVTLHNADGTPAQHADGTPVAAVQTDSVGHYSFDALEAGSYTASFTTLPTGYVLTTQAAGTDDSIDSNPVVSTGVTPAFAIGPPSTTPDMRSIEPGDGVTEAAAINPTIDAGIVVGPAVSVGDFVWEDSNHNGVQDSGEPGISGVTVSLTGPGGGTVTDIFGNTVGPVQTGSTGAYQFGNLPVLPSGESYTTHVDNSQPALTGYLPTLTGQGATSTDSSDGHASSGDLTSGGASDLTLDYGFVRPVSVGDFVWVDTNHNGLQDAGEPGISGVVLTITDTAGNPVEDLNGDTVGPQTTDSQGAYHFTNLSPGQYVVHIDNSQQALSAYTSTIATAGTDRAKDSETGSATSSVLASGGTDETLDFGFVVPPPASGNGGQHSGNPPAGGGSDSTTTTSSSGSTGLADTGVPVEALIWLALTALLGGFCLAVMGRRRRT